MADGQIEIDLKLNEQQATAQANTYGQRLGQQIQQSVDQASSTAKQSTAEAFAGIGDSLSSFGASYSKAVTLPILAAGAATGAATVKIDTALTGVRKTVDGTEQQYQQLKQAAIDFSQTNAVDPAQILDIQALGAQLGYSIDELQMFGEVVSGLDIATNMNAEEAATELAQFANIMGMAHDETKNYGSTIVELGNNFATTEADISHMAMRIAGAGKQIGLSSADVLGLATALSSMGIEAEAGGTAISTIMSQIDKDVALGTDNVQTWAETAQMSVQDFANAWRTDAVGALSAVLVGMDAATQSGGNMSLMLEELGINSIRQTDTLKRLASNSSFLGDAVEVANNAWRENTALDKEVENRNASLAAQFEILKNKVVAIAESVGVPLMNSLMAVIDTVEPLIQALASGAKAFSELDEGAQRAVLTAVAIVAAFGPMAGIVGKAMTAVNAGAANWERFRTSMAAVKASLTATNAALNAQSASMSSYRKIMVGGQEVLVRYNAEAKKAQVINAGMASATKAQTAAATASVAAHKAQAVAMNVASTAAKGLGTALKAIAPVAVLSVVVGIITSISEAMGAARERSEALEGATTGLSEALGKYKSAAAEARGTTAELAGAVDGAAMSYEDATQAQADMADAIGKSLQEVGTRSGQLDAYIGKIEELTGKTNLNTTEQAQLVDAVKRVNDIMGTSYSVTDAENGILSTNIDMIKRSADAWRERAEAQALQEASADILKQQIINEASVAAQIEKVTAAEKNLEYVKGTSGLAAQMAANEELEREKQNLKDLQEQGTYLESSLKTIEGRQFELSHATNTTVDALTALIESSEGINTAFTTAFEGFEVPAQDFIATMSQVGVSTTDLNNYFIEHGDEGIDALVKAYKAGGDEFASFMDANFPAWKDKIEQGVQSWNDALSNAGLNVEEVKGNLADLGVSVETLSTVFATEGQAGIDSFVSAYQTGTVGLVGWMAAHGIEIPTALAQAAAAGKPLSDEAARQIAEGAQQQLDNVDGRPAGEQLVGSFAEGENAGKPEAEGAAREAGHGAEAAMRDSSAGGYGIGFAAVASFAEGIRAAVASKVAAAVGSLRSAVSGMFSGIRASAPLVPGPNDIPAYSPDGYGASLAADVPVVATQPYIVPRVAPRGAVAPQTASAFAPLAQLSLRTALEGAVAAASGYQVIEKGDTYIDNSSEVNINQPIATLEEADREVRRQRTYGLAGQRSRRR